MTQEFEFQLIIKGADISRVFLIPRGRVTIGRQSGNDLVLEHPQISRQHAQLDCSAVECLITDLGSSNGTRVEGEPLTPHVSMSLADAAVIEIGPLELTVVQKPVKVLPPVEESLGEPVPLVPARTSPAAEGEPSPERVEEAAQPPIPPAGPPPVAGQPSARQPLIPPGLSRHSQRLLDFLPGIYHSDFMARYLGLFESILIPIEWIVDNFDLYLDPGTAPSGFLPWLADWFRIAFDPTWSQAQRRTFLTEAHQIYGRRGTRWALSRVLEIYTHHTPEIVDLGSEQPPHTFSVRLPLHPDAVKRELVEHIIDANKPAHTSYTLEFE